MKKLVLLLIFNITLSSNLLLIPLSNAEYKVDYSSLKKTELITTYIKNLKKEIDVFKQKYDINNNINLENEVVELDKLIIILNNFSKKNFEKEEEDKIMLIILEKLKKSKEIIKNILKVKKIKYEKDFNKKRDFYLKVWENLNKQINSLIINIYDSYKNKDNLSENEISIIKILKGLNEENLKLKSFKNIDFSSENEMTTSIVRILKNTKKLMLELKKYD